jgi:hypothetical protein
MTTINATGNGLTGATGSGSFVGSTSPTITTPQIAQINDTNGNAILGLNPIPSAVNFVYINNNATGSPTAIGTTGSDPNVALDIICQGTGTHNFYSQATSNQINFNYGASENHVTIFNFQSSVTSRTVTFPDATGTLQLQSQAIISAPGNSTSSALAVGTNFQNTTGNDIVLTIYLAVSAATSANILVGVGSASSPTQQTIVSGLTVAALSIIPIPIYIPNNYYALVSTSGTITQTISGQMAMPV